MSVYNSKLFCFTKRQILSHRFNFCLSAPWVFRLWKTPYRRMYFHHHRRHILTIRTHINCKPHSIYGKACGHRNIYGQFTNGFRHDVAAGRFTAHQVFVSFILYIEKRTIRILFSDCLRQHTPFIFYCLQFVD